jgi:hypothetical protein
VDVLEQAVGGILIVVGIALWSLPPAFIALGLMIALHGFLREMKSIREKELTDGSREPTALDDPTRYP